MNSIQTSLHQQALTLSKNYRSNEIDLISLLQEIERNRVHLELGFSSLFSYCVDALELSEERAYTFIAVQRKCVGIPKLKEKIQEGKITVSKARRVISVLTKENQKVWLYQAETISKAELEKKVAAESPQLVRESVRVVSEDRYALKVGITEELLQKLRRAQTLLSNQKKQSCDLEQVLEHSIDEFLNRKDPLRKPSKMEKTTPQQCSSTVIEVFDQSVQGGIVTVDRKPIPAAIKSAVIKRDEGKCQWKSPVTNKICGSSYFLNLHHRKQVRDGGLNTFENLIVLCGSHHQYHHKECH